MKKILTSTSNLYLIGPMGAGKSSIGRKLSELTKRHFYDSDYEIEARSGVSISWIFEKEHESGFRRREAQVIHELAQNNGVILSTGGGAILNEHTRTLLKNTGFVIYLSVSNVEQLARVELRKSSRPLLEQNPATKLQQLNEERRALYESLADLTVKTDGSKSSAIAQQIWHKLCNIAKHSSQA